MNTFGKNIRFSLFGESHGECLGVTIDGIPSNITIDENLIKENLIKRKGNRQISTLRQEENCYEIISGYFNNNHPYKYCSYLWDHLVVCLLTLKL